MKRTAQIYIEGNRVDLFEDEQIQLNSSIQTIKDISKVFNDFTQSFTVPASDNNNQIFQHFYNSEVILRNGGFIDHQIKRVARIEIDGVVFREGKIALEKANLKDGMPYNYQCTFYGELTALKDKFGETQMNELDWSAYNHEYDYSEVKLRIEDWQNDYDVRYPLISSERYWQYGNPTTPAENIDTPAGAVLWTELSPALKVRRVMETIESNFGIEFVGSWLNDIRFQNAYSLFKNSNAYTYTTPGYTIDFLSINPNTPLPSPNVTIDLVANSIRIQYGIYYFAQGQFNTDIGYHQVEIFTSGASSGVVAWYVDVYKNGQLLQTVQSQGNATEILLNVTNTGNVGLDDTYTFEFRSDAPLFIIPALVYRYYIQNFLDVLTETTAITCNGITTQQLLNLASNAPEMSVAEYFSNILKMFNLTCYGIGNDQYVLETVEEWYDSGTIYDITEYVDVKNIDVERIPLYQKIMFSFQESKSITNRQFATVFLREYGDLEATYQYEGGEYKIELGFETLLFSKFTNTQVQVGYLLDEDLKPYVPKPIILYQTGAVQSNPFVTANWYLTDGAVTDLISSFAGFGMETINQGDFKQLTWGVEVSPYLEEPIQDGLYEEYYSGYIENLYDFRNRRVKVKTVLPISILTALDLNDRVVIRDKRYLIDTLTNNLTTGESTLELLMDFRDIQPAEEVGGNPPVLPPIFVPDTPIPPAVDGCFEYYVRYPKECIGQSVTITDVSNPPVPGVTITPNTLTEPGYVTICIPDNPTPVRPVVNERPYQPKPSKEVFLIREAQPYYMAKEVGQNRLITIRFAFDCGDKVIIREQQFNQEGVIVP